MKKEPIFVAFSSQKGGVGKSTFTALAASYLHYVLGYNVLVVDCDYPQCSLQGLRKRELDMVESNPHYRSRAIELFESLGKQPYTIISSKPEGAIPEATKFLERSNDSYDIVFFDMAGTINNSGILITYLMLDYVLAPMLPSRMVLESTLNFLLSLKELKEVESRIRLREIYLFWNRIDRRVKRDIITSYEKVISELGLKKLNTEIPQSIRFDKEQSANIKDGVFLSTLFPPDKNLLAGSNLDYLIEEFITVTNLKR